ncbi:MAG: sulfurtransferase [Candidatus Dormibacteria bacterium]
MSQLGPLLDAGTVRDLVGAGEAELVEVTMDHASYLDWHLPGSRWAGLHEHFAPVRPDGRQYGIPTAEEFAHSMSALGISPGRRVVFADEAGNRLAARAYWVCRLYQHAPAHVLDGGRVAWRLAELPITHDAGDPVTRTQYPVPDSVDTSVTASAEDVVASLERHSEQLCDVRTEQEFHGVGSPGRSARHLGHIPGAVWVPWERAVSDDQTYRDLDSLRAVMSDYVGDPRPKIAYCQGGIRAASTWFVLSELLGVPARLYAPSWEEWGNRDDLPVEPG